MGISFKTSLNCHQLRIVIITAVKFIVSLNLYFALRKTLALENNQNIGKGKQLTNGQAT